MKINYLFHFAATGVFLLLVVIGCNTTTKDAATAGNVDANIKKYVHVWGEIVNKRKLEMFNDSNFTANVIIHASPKDAIGIDSAKSYYANYLTGFSNIEFIINDVFGQDDKLVKHWTFKGKHTGPFFGIPATGKTVSIDGTTLVRMEGGKIAEERDFLDNLELSQQLGLIPR